MREFKVGDRVMVSAEADDLMCRPQPLVGLLGTVVSSCDENCRVEIDEPFGDFPAKSCWGFAPWELSIVESDPINHPDHYQSESSITGGRVNYYLARIDHPQREDQPAYTAECEDIISALAMTFDEANIFKEIWRSSNARLGNGKPDHKAMYGAEKINHYAGRNLRRHQREAQK